MRLSSGGDRGTWELRRPTASPSYPALRKSSRSSILIRLLGLTGELGWRLVGIKGRPSNVHKAKIACPPEPKGCRALRSLKRALDFVLSLVGLVLLSPLLAILAALVYLEVGRPVIFRQQRPGWKGRPFIIYKFRTMRDLRDSEGRLLDDAARLTRFGRFFRSTSLDELPELFNVLKGDMSLVGPRPLLMEYLDRYTPEQARRHDVRPGITGWAQVHGRNALSWEEEFDLDVWYVDHWSLWLDIKILFMTVGSVLRREGISQPGRATRDYFLGTQTPGEMATQVSKKAAEG